MNPKNDYNKAATALITGASSGIGAELARVFAKHGHNLVLTARRKNRLEELAESLRRDYGIKAEVLPMDLSLESGPDDIYKNLKQKNIRIDILVNNAGLLVYGRFSQTSWERERKLIQVNTVALSRLIKLFVPDMIERGYGRVLNIGSTGSFIPSPLNTVYSASKSFVLSLSEAASEELRGTGVTMTAVCPGATRTGLQEKAGEENVLYVKIGVMHTAKVAEYAYRKTMAGKRVAIPGFFPKLQIHFTKLLPRFIRVKLAGFALK